MRREMKEELNRANENFRMAQKKLKGQLEPFKQAMKVLASPT